MRRDFWIGWLFGVASIWFVAIVASVIVLAAPGDTLGHGDCKGTEWEKVRWERTAKGGAIAVETEPCHVPAPVVAEASPQSTGLGTDGLSSLGGVSATSGGCPSYMAGEASSPSDVNPTSGAAGCFQILPSTAAAHGCTDVGVECAQRICATQGDDAWVAADPCGYIGTRP